MNQLPLDIEFRSLQVFAVVAREGSFTRAGRELGLTQSAVSRQIQQLEEEVGAELLSRTTRRVELTEAGESFLEVSARLTSDLETSLKRFRESHANQPPEVKVGISHSISHAHLPGLLKHFWRNNPGTKLDVSYGSSASIAEELVDRRIDVGICTRPAKRLSNIDLAHSFDDELVQIEPSERCGDRNLPWLAIDPASRAGEMISNWLGESKSNRIDLPNFDLIINLVSVGVGKGVVPTRALRTYGRRQAVQIIPGSESRIRKIGVFTRAKAEPSPSAESFIQSILFGWKNPSN